MDLRKGETEFGGGGKAGGVQVHEGDALVLHLAGGRVGLGEREQEEEIVFYGMGYHPQTVEGVGGRRGQGGGRVGDQVLESRVGGTGIGRNDAEHGRISDGEVFA